MATMATFPPVTSSYDLPIWPLPNNFYDDLDEEFPYHFFLSAGDECPMDFTVIPDIVTQDGNEHTDLSEIEVTPLYTPPTPEPEPIPTQAQEVTQDLSKQETNGVTDSFSLEEDGKIKCEQNNWPCSEVVQQQQQQQHQQQQQQQQQQQEQFKECETKMENVVMKQEPVTKDEEALAKAEERSSRRSHPRYSLRNILGSTTRQSRPTVRKTVTLWQFLKDLLDTDGSDCVSWVSKEEGTFKFVDSKQAAKLWGQKKNKRNMTYEKLSRALRYYYDRQIMFHEEGQKLIYRFGDVVMKNGKQSDVEAS